METLERHILLGFSQKQVVRNNVLARQAAAIDFANALEQIAIVGLTCLDRRGREVRQPVVVPRVANAGRKLRKLPQRPLPLVIEKRVQLLRLVSILVVGANWRDHADAGHNGSDCQR